MRTLVSLLLLPISSHISAQDAKDVTDRIFYKQLEYDAAKDDYHISRVYNVYRRDAEQIHQYNLEYSKDHRDKFFSNDVVLGEHYINSNNDGPVYAIVKDMGYAAHDSLSVKCRCYIWYLSKNKCYKSLMVIADATLESKSKRTRMYIDNFRYKDLDEKSPSCTNMGKLTRLKDCKNCKDKHYEKMIAGVEQLTNKVFQEYYDYLKSIEDTREDW